MHPVRLAQTQISADRKAASGNQPAKTTKSKFDALQNTVSKQDCDNVAGPTPASSTPENQEALKQELRRKIDAHPSRRPAEVFGEDLKAQHDLLNKLKQRIAGLPPSSAVDRIQQRLTELDSQFRKTGIAVDGMTGSASPKQLLKLQMDMYQLSEKLGIVSKMTDEATSGIKSILQTQI